MHLSRQAWHIVVMQLAGVAALIAVAACSASTSADARDTATYMSCVLPGPAVTPASATIRVGDTLRVAVASRSIGCGATSVTTSYWWASSDTAVASVDSASGLVRGRAAGVASIITTAVVDPTVKGAMVLQVVKP